MRVRRHRPAVLDRARAAYIELRGRCDAATRAAQIAQLPAKTWRGVRVYALTCEGPYGRGPHRQWVPEWVCWALIDLRHWLCPFHR